MVPPIRACQTCKTRRIKCDGAKPTCQRCTKSKRICVEAGAAKEPQFSIHDENSYASGKLKRPRGPRSSLTILRPQFDLQTRALSYYLQFHLMTPKDVPKISGGLSECISAWAVSGRIGSCSMVDLALSSMALAVFSRTQFHPLAAVEASSRYVHLIHVARKRIAQLTKSLDEKDIDSCLLAVSLMGRYENVKHLTTSCTRMINFNTLSSWSHTDGSMAIMKVWYDKLKHKETTSIIKHTRRGLLKTCLLRRQCLPDWMLDGAQFGEQDDELLCDRVLVQLIRFLHDITKFKQRSGVQASAAKDLYYKIQELEKDLLHWAALIPDTCAYIRHTLPNPGPWPQTHFYSATVFSYPKPENASAWCHYFSLFMLFSITRMRVLEIVQAGSDQLPDSDYEEQRLDCNLKLNTMTDNLARSVPFCIDRFKVDTSKPQNQPASVILNLEEEIKPYLATLAAWPLSIAASLNGINPEQQQWFKSELSMIGTITGDAVLECAGTNHWAIL